ncbi:hypothetical protein BUPH_05534 [Paraburkholderia phenoliruptrix BR3459a]|uniref:Uncharacterized protein n=1 Tax=Paraburkholderia phenoliruptrix BR3459a TaxID=1229205 RepID=K0DLX5_9BURK|nr:hypothetical protein BUPH_05534 [Paraburkholderia phenoliruptrix BR3459a]
MYTWCGTLNISSFLPLGRVYTRPAGRRNFRGSSETTRARQGVGQANAIAECEKSKPWRERGNARNCSSGVKRRECCDIGPLSHSHQEG